MVPCGSCGASIFISSELKPLETVPCKKCGHPVMKPMMLRQFELRAVLASGGMGTVYRAFDTTLERNVAVKLMKRELVTDAEAVENFSREARICAVLNHTNIIHIYTFDDHEGEKYIVMELSDAGSLEDRIRPESPMDELGVLDVGIKIASALSAALHNNLLHLDIKPANILYNADGEPKLVDFGLAKHADDDQDYSEDGILGTPEFLAPERTQFKESFHSDMYSLAATMYNAITGQLPFTGDSPSEIAQAHVDQNVTAPIELVRISEATNEAILRGMEKDPSHRFPTYDDFIMALEAARSHLLIQRYASGHDYDEDE